MTLYAFISSGLSYVFTTIIYLFIFSVIKLIYLDIRKTGDVNVNAHCNNRAETESARLLTVKSDEAVSLRLNKQYIINGFAVLGRGRDCEIQIKDKFLSVEHFQVWFEDGEWYLQDMKSRNGTYVNDIRVRRTVILDFGDEISVGGLSFIFEA